MNPCDKTLVISSTGHGLPHQQQEVSDMGDISYQAQNGHCTHRQSMASSSSYVINPSNFSLPGLFSRFIGGPISFWLGTQSPSKTIAAKKDVLATYHESFLYGKVALSTKVRAAIRGPFLSTLLLMLECIAALLLLVLYVRNTYTTHAFHWITLVQFICSIFFLIDYLIKIYSSPVRLYYVLSLNGVVDLISTLPVLFILTSGLMENAAIPQLFLVFRVLRAVPFLSSCLLPGGPVGQEIFKLIAYVLGVFILAAGVLQWVEWRATPQSVLDDNGCARYGCLSFYEALYFVIVTVSTVGYGDITLKSDWGRLIALLIIIVAIVLIPVEINNLLELASRRPYGGTYAVRKIVGSRYIIVSGNLSYQAVEDFLSEFYHPSHAKDMRTLPLRMVIMAPFKPSFEMKVLLTQYKGRIEFIEGTPLKNSDLERVSANVASAFFLMADHSAKDLHAEDATQIMRALSVHRYCGSNVRLIVEMLKLENQDNPIWDDADGGIEIVCPEAIRYQLLARSCQIKGISTFVVNLFKAGLKVCNPMVTGHWMQQYCHGQQHEIYPIILPPCFYEHQLFFEEVVEIVYLKFEIILFGLDISMDNDMREVLLFPRQRVIEKTDIGLVIAMDLSVAEKVSTYCKEWAPSWCTKLYKKCNKNFQTDYEREDLLIHYVKNKRNKHSRFDDGGTGSSRLREKREQTSGFTRYGMMRSGHRSDVQTQLREIVATPSNDRLESWAAPEFTEEMQHSEVPQKLYSLQEAVEMIIQWPPLRHEKPDLPILEKRADAIQKNLDERTLTLVRLSKPHVLLCIHGKWPENVFCFVAHLRSPSSPNPPIVIIHPHKPTTRDWGCVGMFDDVFFLQGSAIHEIDLMRAGVLQAEKVVVLASRGGNDSGRDLMNGEQFLTPSSSKIKDIDNVLIAATIERLLHPMQGRLIVELQQETEIQFLRPKLRINPHRFDQQLYNRNRSATFLFAPAFVEGKGFCAESLTFLLYALFFNRNTVAITEKLISGGEVAEGARLEQVPLPKAYEGLTFGQLLVGLLHEEHWLALGLYRSSYASSSSSSSSCCISYVYTNPPRDEVLCPGDLVYVLC